MLELMRKYVDALTGITELPRERAERLVHDLQKRGEIRARDLGRAAQDLVERSSRNRRELVRLVQKEIRRQVHALGLATQEDVDRVARRVKALEQGRKPSTRSGARKPAARGAAKTSTPPKT